MTKFQWQDKTISLDIVEHDGAEWVSLNQVVATVDGHLKALPGQAIGFCLPNDICLPLGQDQLREDGSLVQLSALVSLGIVSDSASTASHILLGDPLPDVTFARMDGGHLRLRDLPQKPTLLFAWASW